MNLPPRIPRRRAAAAALLLASVPCASAAFYADAGGDGLLDGDGAALLKGGAPTRRRLRFNALDATGSTSTTGIAQFKRPKAKKKAKRKRAKQAKKGESMSYSKSGKASISMSYGSKSAKASMDYSTWKEAGGKTADAKKEKSKKKEDGRFRAKVKKTKTKDGDGDEDPSNFQVKAKGSKSEESMSYSKSAKANDSMSYSKSEKKEESMSHSTKSAKNSLSYGSKSKKENEEEEDGRFDAAAKSAKSKGDKGMSHTDGDPDGDMSVGRFKTSRCAKGSKSEDSMSYSKSGKANSMSYSKSAKNSLSYGSKGGKDSTGRFAVPGAEEEEGDGTGDRSDGRFDYAKSSKNSLSYGSKGSKSNDSMSYSKSAKSDESMSYDPCAKAGKSKGRKSKGGKGLDTKAPSASPTITPQPTDIPTLNPTMAPTTLCPAEAIYCQCFEEPGFPGSYPEWTTSSLPADNVWEFTVPSPSPNMPNEAACGIGNLVSGSAVTLSEVALSSNPDWPDGYLYFSVWTTVNAPNDSFKWFVNGIEQGGAMDQPEWVQYRIFLEGNGVAKTVMWVYNYIDGEAFEANLDFVYFVPGPASLDPIEAVAEEAIEDVEIEDYEPEEDETYADAPKEGDEPF